jgi:hypothetical protein
MVKEIDDLLQTLAPPLPRPFMDKVHEKAQDKLIEEIIDNPLALMDRANMGMDIITKLLPTLPGETAVPMPRGLYEKLKESGSLPGGPNAGAK